jgi:hypothetical protein
MLKQAVGAKTVSLAGPAGASYQQIVHSVAIECVAQGASGMLVRGVTPQLSCKAATLDPGRRRYPSRFVSFNATLARGCAEPSLGSATPAMHGGTPTEPDARWGGSFPITATGRRSALGSHDEHTGVRAFAIRGRGRPPIQHFNAFHLG